MLYSAAVGPYMTRGASGSERVALAGNGFTGYSRSASKVWSHTYQGLCMSSAMHVLLSLTRKPRLILYAHTHSLLYVLDHACILVLEEATTVLQHYCLYYHCSYRRTRSTDAWTQPAKTARINRFFGGTRTLGAWCSYAVYTGLYFHQEHITARTWGRCV